MLSTRCEDVFFVNETSITASADGAGLLYRDATPCCIRGHEMPRVWSNANHCLAPFQPKSDDTEVDVLLGSLERVQGSCHPRPYRPPRIPRVSRRRLNELV